MNPKMHLAWEKPRGKYQVAQRKFELMQLSKYRGNLVNVFSMMYLAQRDGDVVIEVVGWCDGGGVWVFHTVDGEATKLMTRHGPAKFLGRS